MNTPLIVGAGPVGLGAALFLARQGQRVRLIETRDEPSTLSKALAVNPRTLDLLGPTGVTAKMLTMGKPVAGMQFHRGAKVIAEVKLADVHPRYPFMLALSQATTEHLLAEALTAAGGTVERGVEMTECRNVEGGVEAIVKRAADGTDETVRAPWLLAADGARSTARKQMNVDFSGSTFEQEWYLADVVLNTSLTEETGHVFFHPEGGFLFMFRVVNDARTEDPLQPVWRLVGNWADVLGMLVDATPVGPPIWESKFRVSHRIVSSFSAGNVYFAGDAAHIHSPMGARGMNLGLEDACVFASLATAGRLNEYNALRHPVDSRVVHQVEFFSRLVSSNALWARFVKRFVFPVMFKTPMYNRIRATVTGLDHDLPNLDDPTGGGAGPSRGDQAKESYRDAELTVARS